MRRDATFREVIVHHGLTVAVVVTLSVAALLAGTGLVIELVPTRMLVLTEQRPILVASQSTTGEPDQADDHAHDDADPDAADPDQAGAGPTDRMSQPGAGPPGESDVAERPERDAARGAEMTSPPPGPALARVRPTPGPRGAPRAVGDLPIVMYHHVGPLPPNPDAIRRDLTVSPELFERTLKSLAERGIETVTLADLAEHFAGGPALPRRAVALTFDDGYDDNYDHAFRLLRQYGMVGTFFITTDFVERPGYLTWAQIAEMAEAGMAIEAHSVNHADFTKLGPAELRRQLAEPKALLEQATGQKVRFLAYPAGKYDAAVIAATRAAGYEAAVTVLHGTRHTPASAFELRRVRARGADTVAEIMARMSLPSWGQ